MAAARVQRCASFVIQRDGDEDMVSVYFYHMLSFLYNSNHRGSRVAGGGWRMADGIVLRGESTPSPLIWWVSVHY